MQQLAETASLPYHEPGIVTILTQSSFFLVLNVVNYVLDKAVYCGLLGQVFIGIAWGTPGAKWLGVEVERVVVQLGYLGLLLLVYQGGLSTSLQSLKANLLLSICVAITGIGLPIGSSFVLQHLTHATPIQCFAAGAALCSTSLGTTFTVLSASGLAKSRLGVVLSTAAMMDDVVGLVMVQIISNLGQNSGGVSAVATVRPLLVSSAFVVLAMVACLALVRPATLWLNSQRARKPLGFLGRTLKTRETALLLHTLILVGCVTAASFAGTSNLFAAYLAGVSITWWDSVSQFAEAGSPRVSNSSTSGSTAEPRTPRDGEGSTNTRRAIQDNDSQSLSGLETYEMFYLEPVDRIMRPLFFVRCLQAYALSG
ncbi:Cation/H+ exchanger [Metarhizium album ARSEF 1941]|uniref:Cation/H+ exchanger n=1 Tax=Metarhizium album (strain ARSEF 1941) TaxID=1081103 RepID=A0A0B2WR53_METAS|nr:Cation/H+ exchanger [Metarhizium album ARSEF 1941]KHN96099.1 Cation/H+ exchanger [Metarhizium album ARSEF 1941]